MEYFSFIVIMSLVFVLAGFGVFFVHRSHKKDQQKQVFRQVLANKIQHSPLMSMLQALGVGPSAFLYKESVDIVSDCIKRCENCETPEQCAASIKMPELNPDDIKFCANRNYLSKHSRECRIKNNCNYSA